MLPFGYNSVIHPNQSVTLYFQVVVLSSYTLCCQVGYFISFT